MSLRRDAGRALLVTAALFGSPHLNAQPLPLTSQDSIAGSDLTVYLMTMGPGKAVWERFGGRTAVIPHLGLNNDDYFADNQAYLEHVLATSGHDRGLCIVVAPGPGDAGGMPAFAERVRETLSRSRR